jgi:hypothetical protein
VLGVETDRDLVPTKYRTLESYASGNKSHIKWIDKEQYVQGFVSTVRSRMKGGAGDGAAAPATSEPDAADQIRRLAQLRDEAARQAIMPPEESNLGTRFRKPLVNRRNACSRAGSERPATF